mgnify:CR=1 FL=1
MVEQQVVGPAVMLYAVTQLSLALLISKLHLFVPSMFRCVLMVDGEGQIPVQRSKTVLVMLSFTSSAT